MGILVDIDIAGQYHCLGSVETAVPARAGRSRSTLSARASVWRAARVLRASPSMIQVLVLLYIGGTLKDVFRVLRLSIKALAYRLKVSL